MALVVVSWSMYGWTMEQGTVLWSINMCQFVLRQDMKTVEEGIVKFPLLQESQRDFTDNRTWESLIENLNFRIEGVEQNGVEHLLSRKVQLTVAVKWLFLI